LRKGLKQQPRKFCETQNYQCIGAVAAINPNKIAQRHFRASSLAASAMALLWLDTLGREATGRRPFFSQQNAKAAVLARARTNRMQLFGDNAMQPIMMLRSRALGVMLLAVLCAGAVRAEPPDPAADAPPPQAGDDMLELGDEPLDLSTPVVEPRSGKATNPFAKPGASTGWDAKVGVDYRKPSFPAAEFQPDQLTAGAIPDQSTGVAWANVTAPGLESPLGWDKTAIETRLDPSQDQGKLGTTLSRSVPVGSGLSVTLQNGYSVTRTHPSVAAATAASQSWATNQALRLNILPTDTTVSLGAAISSTDDKWLRTLSAEQKLLGGPLSVTGAVSETAAGDTSKSLKAGFKRTW